jgi:membrane protein
VSVLLNAVEFAIMAGGMAALYHFVPHTHVRWRHAVAGGVFVAIGLEVAKRLLAWYVSSIPTISAVYGAFAAVPILLLWVYVGWLIVLWGAVIAAYAPSLSLRVARVAAAPGHRFALALAVIGALARARSGSMRGLAIHQLAAALATDPLQVEPVVDTLVGMDWVAPLDEEGSQRFVLLADPGTTPARALVNVLLLESTPATRVFRERTGLERLTLAELI